MEGRDFSATEQRGHRPHRRIIAASTRRLGGHLPDRARVQRSEICPSSPPSRRRARSWSRPRSARARRRQRRDPLLHSVLDARADPRRSLFDAARRLEPARPALDQPPEAADPAGRGRARRRAHMQPADGEHCSRSSRAIHRARLKQVIQARCAACRSSTALGTSNGRYSLKVDTSSTSGHRLDARRHLSPGGGLAAAGSVKRHQLAALLGQVDVSAEACAGCRRGADETRSRAGAARAPR